jgi:hypothetical protein
VAETATMSVLPEWTEYRTKNGRDPLGMQAGSINIYQSLLPGISNVTLRIRYYGLYVWLSRAYAKRIGDTNPKTWQRFVRRAEALYALIATKRGGETGVAGVEWATKILDASDSVEIDFATAAEPGAKEYYLKQAWGAFGAAYRSQLYEVGIFADAKGHEIPVPSPELGEQLASAFANSVGPLTEKFFNLIQKGGIFPAELDELAPLSPSEIPQASRECACYQNMLFAQAGLERPADQERRRTLLLILLLSERIAGIPDVSDLRWMLYTNRDLKGDPLVFDSPEIRNQRMRWWIYQANDLLHIAYETLLKYVLDLLESYPAGITLAELIGESVENLRSSVDNWPNTWESHILQTPTDEPESEKSLSTSSLKAARPKRLCSPEGAWHALELLAVVHARARDVKQEIHNEFKRFDPAVFHTLLSEIDFLESHSSDDFVVTLKKLIEQRILKRHLWIALKKLRYQGDYTFLMECDEGRVRLRAKDGPVFTNPRLVRAVSFLKDTHLIDGEGISEQGRRVLGAA